MLFFADLIKSCLYWGCVVVVLAVFFPALPAFGFIDVTLQMQLGNPSGATSDPNNHTHYLIQRSVEALDYNDTFGEPNWASWDLTAGDVGTNSRSASFFTDTNLPAGFYRVTDSDYVGVGTNGFARGHLCPSEDRTDTRADNDLVFFMSNIMPQDAINNSGVWAQFENYCRSQLSSNELLITCGPSGFGTNRIPSGKAYIPDYTWKIVVVVPTNSGTALSRITAATRVISLKVPNADSATNTWPAYVVSANQIQVDTGLTFFTALPAGVAATLRAKVDGQTNPPPAIYAFSPSSGPTNTVVVLTGTNFTAATQVAFNGVSAAFTVNSSTQLTATVPGSGSSGFVSVTTASGTAISTNSFNVTGVGGGSIYSGILAGWNTGSLSGGAGNYGPSPFSPVTNAPNLAVDGLTRGSGVKTSGTAAGGAWGGVGFTNLTAAAAVASNLFATFSLTVSNGYQVSLSSISRFDYYRSGTGPTNGVLQFQVGTGGFTDITNLTYPVSGSGSTLGAIDLSGIVALQNVGASTSITFRIVNYSGAATGTWYVYNTAGTLAPDLAVTGTIMPVTVPGPPGFQSFSMTGGNMSLTVTGAVATSYTILASTNLANPNWMTLLTTNPATLPFVFVDTNRLSQCFYRVQNP